jgi:glycosyltransferase involved in cell wall biosynthesis
LGLTGGRVENGWRPLAQELGIAESVSFFGSMSGNEKWDVLRSTDVFVHPSRWEGIPFAVL